MLNGKLIVNVAPFSYLLFPAQILPPCDSIMLFEMYRPRPVPVVDLVANFVNSLGNISSWIPIPVSFISIITSSSPLPLLSFSPLLPFLIVVEAEPVFSMNLTAFSYRFEITWVILCLSSQTRYLSFSLGNRQINSMSLVIGNFFFVLSILTPWKKLNRLC